MKVIIGFEDKEIGEIEYEKGQEPVLSGNLKVLKNLISERGNRTWIDFLTDLPRALRNHFWAYIQ